ncbi:MAG: GNAT family N-acetyltransferase [Anaerolineae bacterium]|nr:GNAT family N-acetyltransferase [Anaerolineae bacterium]
MAQPDVEIRPVRPEDAPDLYEIAMQPTVTRSMLFVPSMEFSETEQRVNLEDPFRHYLAAVVDEQAVGAAILSQHGNPRLAHAGHVALMVHPDFWGHSIGTQLMSAVLDIADNWLGLKRVELGVFTDNSAALHLYEKLGFEREGVKQRAAFGDGRWQDEIMTARLRGVPTQPAPEPATSGGPPRAGKLPNLRIRPPHPVDMEALYDIFRHPGVARTTLQLPSQAPWLTRKRLLDPPPGIHRLVAVSAREVVGIATLMPHTRPRQAHSAGLGMSVHPDYWGRGVGSALMAAMVDLADNWLNLRRIELEVNTDNPAGVRLYEKFGFEIEGTYRYHAYGGGRWADSFFMARFGGI